LLLTEVASHLQFGPSIGSRHDDLPVTLEHNGRNERVGIAAEAVVTRPPFPNVESSFPLPM
jgi:hypothetical protein